MTQSRRILQMLQMLSQGQTLCSDTLTNIFSTDKRTIQRDLKLLREHLGEKLYAPSRGCYRLQSTAELRGYLAQMQQSDDIRPFFEFITLFDDRLLSIFDQKEFPIVRQIRRESKVYYHILENPIENLRTPFLKDIKLAIKERHYASVSFKEIHPRDLEMVKPIKIVFAEGNWYLAAITQNYKFNHGFKFLRINFITGFRLQPQTFHREIEAEKFIENFQSLFQDYKTPVYEVRVRVDAGVARYFRVKKHLKSQRIEEEKANGDLIVSFQINNEMEILPFVKKWLPLVRILSPKALDERLKEEIRRYL